MHIFVKKNTIWYIKIMNTVIPLEEIQIVYTSKSITQNSPLLKFLSHKTLEICVYFIKHNIVCLIQHIHFYDRWLARGIHFPDVLL